MDHSFPLPAHSTRPYVCVLAPFSASLSCAPRLDGCIVAPTFLTCTPPHTQTDDSFGNINNKVHVDAVSAFASGAQRTIAMEGSKKMKKMINELGVLVGAGPSKEELREIAAAKAAQEEKDKAEAAEQEKAASEGRRRKAEKESAEAAKAALARAKESEAKRIKAEEEAKRQKDQEEAKKRKEEEEAKRKEEEVAKRQKDQGEAKKRKEEDARKKHDEESAKKKWEDAQKDMDAKKKQEERIRTEEKARAEQKQHEQRRRQEEEVRIRLEREHAEARARKEEEQARLSKETEDAERQFGECIERENSLVFSREGSEEEEPNVEWAKRAVDKAALATESAVDTARKGLSPSENPAIKAAVIAVSRLNSFADKTTNEEEKMTARAAAERVGKAAAATRAALASLSDVERLAAQAEKQRKEWLEKGQVQRDFEKMNAAINMISTGAGVLTGRNDTHAAKGLLVQLVRGHVIGWAMATLGPVFAPLGQAVAGAVKASVGTVGPAVPRAITAIASLGGPAGERVGASVVSALELLDNAVPSGTHVRGAGAGAIGAWAIAAVASRFGGVEAKEAPSGVFGMRAPVVRPPSDKKGKPEAGLFSRPSPARVAVRPPSEGRGKPAAATLAAPALRMPAFLGGKQKDVPPSVALRAPEAIAVVAGAGLVAAALTCGGGRQLSALRGLLLGGREGGGERAQRVEGMVRVVSKDGKEHFHPSSAKAADVAKWLGVSRRPFVEAGGRRTVVEPGSRMCNATIGELAYHAELTVGSLEVVLSVKGEDGTVMKITVARDQRVGEIEKMMKLPMGIALGVGGKQLKAGRTLERQGVAENEVLTLARRESLSPLEGAKNLLVMLPGGGAMAGRVAGIAAGVVGAVKRVAVGVVCSVMRGTPVGDAVKGAAGEVKSAVEGAARQVAGAVMEDGPGIAKGVGAEVGEKVKGMVGAARGKGEAMVDAAKGAAGGALGGAGMVAGRVVEATGKVVDGALGRAGKWAKNEKVQKAAKVFGAAAPALWLVGTLLGQGGQEEAEGRFAGSKGRREDKGIASFGANLFPPMESDAPLPDGLPFGGLFDAFSFMSQAGKRNDVGDQRGAAGQGHWAAFQSHAPRSSALREAFPGGGYKPRRGNNMGEFPDGIPFKGIFEVVGPWLDDGGVVVQKV